MIAIFSRVPEGFWQGITASKSLVFQLSRPIAERLLGKERAAISSLPESPSGSDLGITLADLASVDALQLKLSSPVPRSVSERFYVEYDWLSGKGEQVFRLTPHCWYKSMEPADV